MTIHMYNIKRHIGGTEHIGSGMKHVLRCGRRRRQHLNGCRPLIVINGNPYHIGWKCQNTVQAIIHLLINDTVNASDYATNTQPICIG